MRRRWKVLLAAVALLLAAVLAVSWKAGQDLLHPARDTGAGTPTDMGLAWTWANFTARDGVPLVGWWMPANATTDQTVLFLHGYGDAKDQGLPLYPSLHNHSVNVLAFDFRAHGQSGGDHTTVGLDEVADVQGALDWLENKTGHADPAVVLLGWSMGGATAIHVAALDPRIDGIVTDGAFSRLQRIVETSISEFTGLPKWPFGPLAVQFAGMSIGVDLGNHAPVEWLVDYHGPILLVQGAADTAVTPDQVDELHRSAERADVWKVEGAGHVEAHEHAQAEYEARVAAFLDRVWQA
ncbi:MAG: uncharacterized protein QOD77_204 [Thermoplasmata archaeon]|nr:uncharacterized protein [Thermoplasmata archaeon]